MIEATFESARELVQEIWNVDREEETPAIAQATGRMAERLSNIGTVLIYAVLVAYAGLTLYRMLPEAWRANFGVVGNKWWFWVALVLIVVTALRFGLEITKMLKRWNVASLLGSLLLFDLLLKQAPPLFGLPGFSPVDHLFGALNHWQLAAILQRALGL